MRARALRARARIAAPGAVPLTTRHGDLVAGAVIRVVGHPARQIADLPYARMRSHQVVIGTTSTGNSTLLPPFTSLRRRIRPSRVLAMWPPWQSTWAGASARSAALCG